MKDKVRTGKTKILQCNDRNQRRPMHCRWRNARAMSGLMRRAATALLVMSGVLVMLLFFTSEPRLTRRSLLPTNQRPEARAAADLVLLNGAPRSPLDEDIGYCRPRTSIFFLKTHKCASSTVQNILLRYGEQHALNFVLPASGNYVGSPAPFSRQFIGGDLWPRSRRFDVFAHHTRLNVAESRRVMVSDAVWLTILRDPVAQFESGYDYFGFSDKKHWNMSLPEFIALPLDKKRALPRIGYGRFGGNQMSFDLGYDPAIVAEPRLVEEMLATLDSTFDLVIIAEMMDESLVLLRELMCWSTDDVTYLTRNVRFASFRTELSSADRASLEEYLALDVTLYNHFKRRLAERIAVIPLDTFLARTELLVARRLFWRQRCVASVVKGNALTGQQHEITGHVQGYEISDTKDWMCSRLGMAELSYTDLIRTQQRQRLSVWLRVQELLGQMRERSANKGSR